jgi:DNA-binding transcriptional LysR family regulator
MIMKRIALYHIETLLWISRLGTFAGAANRLNTTQPAISARVKELEAQLGIPLFRREGRRMTLTVRGRKLVEDWEPIWSALEGSLLDITGSGFGRGVIRIGAGEIAAASCLPAFLIDLEGHLPGVTIELAIDLTATMLEQVLGGTRDIVFLAGPVVSPGIRTRSIGAVELLWAASPEVGDRMRREPGWLPTIWSLPHHSPVHGVMRAALAKIELKARAINTINNVRMLVDIIKAGGGIALLPATMIQQLLRSGELCEVLDRPLDAIVFQAVIRSDETDPIVLEIFDRTIDLRIAPARLPQVSNVHALS